MQVPFVSLHKTHTRIHHEFLDKVSSLLNSNEFILGETVRTFEKEYADFSETEFCIGVSNGLDALKIALRTLDIGKGDEIIVPAHTYVATIFAVLEVGAIPILVEPDIDTFNITAATIEKGISPNTKAIIPVHLYGQSCEIESIRKLADQYSLFVIEDNAQAQGAIYNGKRTGSFGHINATSFYPSKNLGAIGDAGAITTDNAELALRARRLRNVGSDVKYYNEEVGYNARLDAIQAAFLSCKLPYLMESNEERNKAAKRYIQNLSGCSSIVLPKTIAGAEHTYHLFVIRLKERDKLQKYLSSHDISTLIHYPVPVYSQPALQSLGYKKDDFPVTEEICLTCLSLPMFAGITQEQVDFVCENIIAFEKNSTLRI